MTDPSQETQRLVQELAKSPELLHQLSPRKFEELVAEILAGFGWEVSLTSATRDGGYDIIAVSKDASNLESTFVIECKKYRPHNKVGVAVVRSLLGAKTQLGISNSVVVTTSQFTKDARHLERSRHDIQLVDFAGVVDWLKAYVPAPDKAPYLPAKSFESCFISFSHQDQRFADYLTDHLRANGVRVWYAPRDMLPGRKLHEEIVQAIRRFDRLLVVLSEHSMRSEWVKSEIRHARRRELEEGKRILFPVALAPFEAVRRWECFDADSGKDLAVELREYLIADFSEWQRPDVFEMELRKLLALLSHRT